MIEVFYKPRVENFTYDYYKNKNVSPTLVIDINKTGIKYQVNDSAKKVRVDFFNRRDREFYLTYNLEGNDYLQNTVSYSFKDFSLNSGISEVDNVPYLYFTLTKYKSSESTQSLRYSLFDYQVFFDGNEYLPDKIIPEVLLHIKRNIS